VRPIDDGYDEDTDTIDHGGSHLTDSLGIVGGQEFFVHAYDDDPNEHIDAKQ